MCLYRPDCEAISNYANIFIFMITRHTLREITILELTNQTANSAMDQSDRNKHVLSMSSAGKAWE